MLPALSLFHVKHTDYFISSSLIHPSPSGRTPTGVRVKSILLRRSASLSERSLLRKAKNAGTSFLRISIVLYLLQSQRPNSGLKSHSGSLLSMHQLMALSLSTSLTLRKSPSSNVALQEELTSPVDVQLFIVVRSYLESGYKVVDKHIVFSLH